MLQSTTRWYLTRAYTFSSLSSELRRAPLHGVSFQRLGVPQRAVALGGFEIVFPAVQLGGRASRGAVSTFVLVVAPLVAKVRAEERSLECVERDFFRPAFEYLEALRALQLIRGHGVAPEAMDRLRTGSRNTRNAAR